MATEEKRMDLDDRIWGITGSVNPDDYMEPAKGNEKNLVYIKYTPATKNKMAVSKLIGRIVSKVLPKVEVGGQKRIPKPIPENQVMEVYTPSVSGKTEDRNGAGQPDRKLVLIQDDEGNAQYEENIRDRESNRMNRLENEKQRAEGETLVAKAESTDIKSDDEEQNQNRGFPDQRHQNEAMH